MPGRPWEKFWYQEWRGDTKLRDCSAAARGVWIEVLCMMWSEGVGTMSRSTENWSRQIGIPADVTDLALRELKKNEVGDIEFRNAGVTITSRRIQRELNKREQGNLRVKKHREKAAGNDSVTDDVTGYVTGRGKRKEERGHIKEQKSKAKPPKNDLEPLPPEAFSEAKNLDISPALLVLRYKARRDPVWILAALLRTAERAKQTPPLKKPGAYFAKLCRNGEPPNDDALEAAGKIVKNWRRKQNEGVMPGEEKP